MWLPFVLSSTLCWSLVNVLDSLLVHRYEKFPLVLQWSQALFSMPVLIVLFFTLDLKTSWTSLLFFFGMFIWLGDMWFFYVLSKLDVSVTNAAWPILSIFLSISGFVFFQESWTAVQCFGAAMILSGTFLLCLYHQHISLLRTLGLLASLALLHTPYYIVKKAALSDGQSVAAVLVWMMLGREVLSFSVPWIFPPVRRRIIPLLKKIDLRYFLLNASVIAFFFLAEYFGARAFASGPLSLVSVVTDIQPFVVIGLAWVTSRTAPAYAPRELLTAQSVGIKLLSFSIAFAGLALLALS